MVNRKSQKYFFIVLFILINSPLHAFRKNTMMVPMRDGVRLATDVYRPSLGVGPWPTILIRTPYGKESAMDDGIAFFLTDISRYSLVIQDTRGRYASEGADSMYFHDGWGRLQDGYDTVEWIAQNSWCSGKIGTWGASAMGITQYLLAGAAPPHLTCCFVIVAASNLYEDAIFYDGAYRRSLVDKWLQKHGSEHLIDFFVQHSNYEPLYDAINLSTRYDSVDVPIFHVGGWHDIFIQGQINAFCGIQEYGGPKAVGYQKLLIGPWVHDPTSPCGELTFPNSEADDYLNEMVQWFDYWLKGVNNGIDRFPDVTYYLMGDADREDGHGNRWVEREDWPPPTSPVKFYLRHDGLLSRQAPSAFGPADKYVYDPDDPVPTVGGRNLNIPAGSYDQRSVESRPDVLVYTTDPLLDPLTVIGRVTVTLWASSDAVDTDFTAKLCDVYPDGRSMLVADGIVQAKHRNTLWAEEFLTPYQIYEFTIDLWSTAIVFEPGHCIRLSVSSSNFERFEKNPNTGEPFRHNTMSVPAHQFVYQDPDHPSAIVLPVVDTTDTLIAASETSTPYKYILDQNYPNPFNNETIIPLHFPDFSHRRPLSSQKTRLSIFDVLGRRVRIWEFVPHPGERITLRWRGDDETGMHLPSGIYVCRLTYGSQVETKKITLMR